MSKKLKTIAGITATALGISFIGLKAIASMKRADSLYEKELEQKNPLEGKKVVFVEDENDDENADGARGHLEAIGNIEYKPGMYEKYVKRAADIMLSFGGLVLLSPVFLATALAIKIDDPGPVLFTQKRLGSNKKYFKLHKFRSMKMSTPKDVPTHMLENPDQYITRVGRFLRTHSLDELPQIWDIFVGNMSVIGPRPALWNQDLLIAERDKYDANNIKPGLTGWAQINGRDELSLLDKAKLDGEYVKKESFLFDFNCFVRTIIKIGRDDCVVEGKIKGEENMDKDKILIISNHSFMLYRFRKALIEKLSEDNDIIIAVPFGESIENLRDIADKLIDIDVDRRGINPIKDILLFRNYYKLIKKERPSKVIMYSIKPNIYGGFAARLLGTDYYVNIQGMGTAFEKKILEHIATSMYKVALKKAERVFFENTSDAHVFLEKQIVNKKQVKVLSGAGIDLNYYKYKEYMKKEIFHFLFLGRIMKEKGIEELLSATEQLSEKYVFKLDIVGFCEEEYEKHIQYLESKGVVSFHGFQSDPRPFYEESDCVVVPSYHEGMSNVNLEAAATGRIVITSDIPGCREAVDDGNTGLLVIPGDVDSLRTAMEEVLLMNTDRIHEMGLQARKKIEEQFEKGKVINETISSIN